MGGGGANVEVLKSDIYGENVDNLDCPPGSVCDHCIDTLGIVSNHPCDDPLPDHKTKWFKFSLMKLCNGNMESTAEYKFNTWHKYYSANKACGSR